MMRNKTSTSLQKTYDECYLICSTAVYFEGQGNEAEALRSWRSALDQIYYHNAYRVPAGYIPKSETEKALKDSLRNMELQCKERVDLLETLKQSRIESVSGDSAADDQGGKLQKGMSKAPDPPAKQPRLSSDSERENGYVGNGTIPAVDYPDLARPPVLPARPTYNSKSSSAQAVVGAKSSSSSSQSSHYLSSRTFTPSNSSSTLAPPSKKSSRSPSPEKGRTMLHTLRTERKGRKPAPKSKPRQEDPLTSRAASLAWQSLGKSGKDSFDADMGGSSATLTNKRDTSNGRSSSSHNVRYDKLTRTLVSDDTARAITPQESMSGKSGLFGDSGRSNAYPFPPTDPGQPGAVSGAMLTSSTVHDSLDVDTPTGDPPPPAKHASKLEPTPYPTYLKEYPETSARQKSASELPMRRKPVQAKDSSVSSGSSKRTGANISSPRHRDRHQIRDYARGERRAPNQPKGEDTTTESESSGDRAAKIKRQQMRKQKQKQPEDPILAGLSTPTSDSDGSGKEVVKSAWQIRTDALLKNLPKGVDEGAAKQIFNEIVVHGDEVHWDDVAGLDIAKKALKEAVVYPFLRPDLFMGLREPARGMLLFGPPGTGKTMLARAVATESRSTFFSISASSLTSKYLGESEKLVRALFSLAKALAPSIIFVDEIDSLLSARSGGEHEATRRIKTEFLIQWSDLQRAAAGREQSEKEKERGDASRVLVLAATNLPWAIDEAARRRFVRRQYIPLPEDETRAAQLRTLLGHQKHSLTDADIQLLISLTEGFSGSDITALAKDAAMGPLRSLGEALLQMSMDDIRPIQFVDFKASLVNIRPSVSKAGLKEFEDWATQFGERGG
ncbi:AAA family ATPase-like protein [Calycina marina]|uniref:AAA family ATPase-like protein n=1 Tax=Calycina marina TaxID=1763456 RepID=A0A9P8CGM7_9HELO|nr:AAA family ATPase-like protein [Calycina marina]